MNASKYAIVAFVILILLLALAIRLIVFEKVEGKGYEIYYFPLATISSDAVNLNIIEGSYSGYVSGFSHSMPNFKVESQRRSTISINASKPFNSLNVRVGSYLPVKDKLNFISKKSFQDYQKRRAQKIYCITLVDCDVVFLNSQSEYGLLLLKLKDSENRLISLNLNSFNEICNVNANSVGFDVSSLDISSSGIIYSEEPQNIGQLTKLFYTDSCFKTKSFKILPGTFEIESVENIDALNHDFIYISKKDDVPFLRRGILDLNKAKYRGFTMNDDAYYYDKIHKNYYSFSVDVKGKLYIYKFDFQTWDYKRVELDINAN